METYAEKQARRRLPAELCPYLTTNEAVLLHFAEQATPGEWVAAIRYDEESYTKEEGGTVTETYPVRCIRGECKDGNEHTEYSHEICAEVHHTCNHKYIAAADPDVIIKLLATIAELRKAQETKGE